MTDRKIVWILGAGFSRSLGGPLLADLFSQEKRLELKERYPECDALWRFTEVVVASTLFAYGNGVPEGWLSECIRGGFRSI